MKPKHLLIRAAFAVMLAAPATLGPIASSAAAFAGPTTYLRPNPSTGVSQSDPSSIRPGAGTVPAGSVGSGVKASATPVPAPSDVPGTSPHAAASPQGHDQFEPETTKDGKRARAGSVIVTFRPGIHASAQSEARSVAGVQSVEPVGRGGAVRVQVEPGRLDEALQAYASRSDVARVEPDSLLFANMTPTDPKYGEEWNLPKIGAPTAWDRVGGASGVKVAVLDTGVANHPDLSGRVTLAQDFTGSPYGSNDRYGHGTHVAGTIAANANNGIGIVGVAWNASILNGKVLGDAGSGSLSSVANGIVWAADNGANVISMSLGANLDCPGVLQDAIDYAWDRGAVIVAAAGNSGMNDAHTPANCDHAIPVGAVNSDDVKASFSNYGLSVPIAAPGDAVLSTYWDGGYVWMSGTSMATPHAAGVAALIWASSYGTGNQAVVNRLLSTADRIAGTGNYWVHGRINAASAVAGSSSPTGGPPPTPSPSPTQPVSCAPRPPVSVTTAKGAPGSLVVTVRAGTGSTATNRIQQVRFGAAPNARVEAGAYAEAGNFAVTPPANSSSYSFTIKRTVPGTTITVPVTVVDGCGDWATFVGGGPNAF
jgi:thermitase